LVSAGVVVYASCILSTGVGEYAACD